MKSFKKFITESEDDPRADINIPYQTPRDIYRIMTGPKGTQDPTELSVKIKNKEERKASSKKRKRAKEKAKRRQKAEKPFEPMAVEDIANKLGITQPRVSQLMASIKTKFGKLADDEKLKQIFKAMGKHEEK
jgi:hypothetical protein